MKRIENQDLILASAAVARTGEASLLETKCWDVMLLNAYNDLEIKEEHEISIRELASIVGFTSNSLEDIKQALRSLVETKVEWNILNKDNKNEWGVAAMLAEARITEGSGICIYSYGKGLREKLHNPRMYVKIKLLHMMKMRFQSKYSLILYKLCLDYIIKVKGSGETPWIKLENMRKLFGIKKDEYSEFRDFNKWTIKPAIQEINEKSDLNVSVSFNKEKKFITGIKFIIDINSNSDVEKAIESMPEIPESELPETKIIESSSIPTLSDTLISLGVSKKQARDLVSQYKEEQIQQAITLVQKSQDKIKNVGGFIKKALEEEWQSKSFDPADERKRKAMEAEREKERQRQELAAKEQADKQQALDVYAAMNDEQRFAQVLKQVTKGNPMFSYLTPENQQRFREVVIAEVLPKSKTIGVAQGYAMSAFMKISDMQSKEEDERAALEKRKAQELERKIEAIIMNPPQEMLDQAEREAEEKTKNTNALVRQAAKNSYIRERIKALVREKLTEKVGA